MARFIVFEGGDACGKSTQAARVAERLSARLTREPGGTTIGASIRQLLLDPASSMDDRAEALLMAADRAQHVAEVIRPTLDAGTHVVSDRFIGSSLAYQGYGRSLGVEAVAELSRFATGGVEPDLIVLLDVPVDVARARRSGVGDRLENEDAGFHERVREGYLALASSGGRWAVVDGRSPIDEVSRLVDALIADRLGL